MKKIIVITGFFGLFIGSLANVSAAYFNAAPIIRCESSISSMLSFGSENREVYELQSILANAGFLSATPNGYFGYQTVRAVRSFQASNGIMATGVVGASTREALNSYSCGTSYSSGVTYVDQIDPYVKVISPAEQAPAIYATPQNNVSSVRTISSATNLYTSPSFTSVPSSAQITGTTVVYNPAIGYTYGITQQSGSITVSSPVSNSIYNEGDTVFVQWSTSKLSSSVFSVVLESSITGKRTTVATLSGNSYSFVLTKDLLDSVCAGSCNDNQTGSFKVTVTTDTVDIAGLTSTLRAAVSPITVRRPLAMGTVTITSSQSPVNSNEAFKVYINVPSGVLRNQSADLFSVKIKAICPAVVTVSIAGASCGQEFMAPLSAISSQQGIPVKAINQTWYKQDVIFQASVVNAFGQTVAVSETKTTVNAAPFGF